MLKQVQLYDDQLDFYENRDKGPFGDYADLNDSYKNSGEPGYDFFGTPVYSPFGIAAGPLPTPRFIEAALVKGFDIVTLKSVRTDSFPVNTYPQVRPLAALDSLEGSVSIADMYTEPLAAANSLGAPSVAPLEWQASMRELLALPSKGQALLVAFQGTAHGKGRDDFVQDHVDGVGLIRETGANVIEINLSCPNEGEAVLACFDTDITERIVTAVRQAHPDVKLLIKIAYFADKAQLRNLVERVGDKLHGISAINTMPATIVNQAGDQVFPDCPTAGVSGAPIRWAGLEMVTALRQFREEFGYDYTILGMGGVLSPEDFNAYREAGADFVLSVTGAMWDPYLAQKIKASL